MVNKVDGVVWRMVRRMRTLRLLISRQCRTNYLTSDSSVHYQFGLSKMCMDVETRTKLLEELKFVSDSYRYRDQLMVTEFSITMAASGLAGNIILRSASNPIIQIMTTALACIFTYFIAYHLYRINEDRIVAGLKESFLRKRLEMDVLHQGYKDERVSIRGDDSKKDDFVDNILKAVLRVKFGPAPRFMVLFTLLVSLIFLVLLLALILSLIF